MRESETQAELRGERAAVVRGAEQPRLGRGVAGPAPIAPLRGVRWGAELT